MKNDILNLEGYLFLKQTNRAQEQYAHFTREKAISKYALEAFSENMHYNNEYCKERNIKYRHIVFPAKMVALKELFKKIGIADSTPKCTTR